MSSQNRWAVVARSLAILFTLVTAFTPWQVIRAQTSFCAEVGLEIAQSLTLERQGFDARMRIKNALKTQALDNVAVTVNFADEDGRPVVASSDPNATNAAFFIRIDSLSGITDINGAGRVGPESEAVVHWLIVPAPGAAGPLSDGKVYLVGATLTYLLDGEEQTTEVSPDSIRVKPMPELTLDYFLPEEVYGDDAFTQAIEPAEPFDLGVRVRNSGQGTARSLRIESAQPKIVDNANGLLVGFELLGASIDDNGVAPSLLLDFGDVAANTARVGRWQMSASLSGRFESFDATFTHSDELGGSLTSLLTATNAHALVHDVWVDLPGRDSVRDFLARDGAGLKVFESENVDTSALDQSAAATLQVVSDGGGETGYNLNFAATDGFAYVKLSDPQSGQRIVTRVLRSDGKLLPTSNVWFSKTRNPADNSWNHFINVFDVNTSGRYVVVYGGQRAQSLAPVLQLVSNRVGAETHTTSFVVEASDPNGGVPVLSAAPLPAGAQFVDQGNGQGVFTWTPVIGQAGNYAITYSAYNGVSGASRTATLKINPAWDTDGDGLDDEWERQHFGDLSRDGTGDFDEDGVLDKDEHLEGTDPTVGPGPGNPALDSPAYDAEVETLTPELRLLNGEHSAKESVTYDFEVYADAAMTERVAGITGIAETPVSTGWTVDIALTDNTEYHWRGRAFNGTLYSEWVNGRFFVNTINDAPSAFFISAPSDGSDVDTLKPTMAITNAKDVDRDAVTYRFVLYSDSTLTQIVASASDILPGDDGATAWTVEQDLTENSWYFWRVTATDEHGEQTDGPVGSFFVDTQNEAPSAPTIAAPSVGSEVMGTTVDLTINDSVDPEGDLLTYSFEIDTVSTFDSANKRVSGPIAAGSGIEWSASKVLTGSVNPDGMTAWQVSGLNENTEYFWRVQASDGAAMSGWVQGRFFINSVNDAPGVPTLNNPGPESWIETRLPTLSVHEVTDVDRDSVVYRFELYRGQFLDAFMESVTLTTTAWVLAAELSDNTWYSWRVQAEDEHGLGSDWSATGSFFVNDNGMDDAPTFTLLEPSAATRVVNETVTVRWADDDPDSSATIALYYDVDNSGGDGVLIVAGLSEDADGAADQYPWNVAAMINGSYWVYAVISDATTSRTVYASEPVTIKYYTFGGFDSPLDAGKVYKLGRVLPVKIGLYDKVTGVPITTAQPTLTVVKLAAGQVIGDPLIVTSSSAADTGNVMRLSGDKYSYNLSTDNYAEGTYRISVDLGDGSEPRSIDIGFK